MTNLCSRPSSRGIVTACSLLAAWLFGAVALTADKAQAGDVETGIHGEISLEEGYIDNVRADHTLREGAWYTTFETDGIWQREPKGWLPHRVGGLMRARIYSSYGNRDYAEFGPSIGYDWELASLTVEYRFSPDHLRVDPATTVDAFADVHNFSAELRSKFGKKKRWTALFRFDFDAEDYDASFRERSFFEENFEAELRCRATQLITPRASVAFSTRDAISSNFDREEVALLFGFDLYLPAGMRAVLRYEKTWRNFIVGNPTDSTGHKNNNFGREDDAYGFDSGLDIPAPWTDSVTVHLRYRYRDNHSTRPDRSYNTNEGSLRLSYDF